MNKKFIVISLIFVFTALAINSSSASLVVENNQCVLSAAEFLGAWQSGTIIAGSILIDTGTNTASFTLTNNTNCTAPISLSTYKMFVPAENPYWLSTQQLFDVSSYSVSPNSTQTFIVRLPQCRTQTDSWYGQAPTSLLDSNPYSYPSVPFVLNWIFSQDPLCQIGQGPTRTLGFWQTHTAYTSGIFSGFGGTLTIRTHIINDTSKLFAGFYASIPKTTSGSQRSALDKARMQMLQQWLAAKLNCQAFGCSSATQTLLTDATTAWAGTNTSLIQSYASQLDVYNNSNDALPISGQGSATPKASQLSASASLSFWDVLP